MTSQIQEQRERRSGTRALIDKMLTERQQMLVLYERVAGVVPYGEESVSDELLREFSQILVDYIASGHFGLYERIADGNERRRGVVKLAGRTLTTGPETFGVCVLETEDQAGAQRIMADDPAVARGVMNAELFPFRIALWGRPPAD